MSVLGSIDVMYRDETPPPAKRSRVVTLPKIRVMGVPEHFNFPFQLAEERGIFEKHGVDVEFVLEPLGTGAMISAVMDNTVDVIVALTEGLVLQIAKGSQLRLLGTYVRSPLCWAISAAGAKSEAHGKIKSIADLKNGRFGVSRLTSGSHLMATVLATERGWDPAKLSFGIKGNFQALRDGVNDGSTDAFMWETFTTKPFHDSQEVHRVGDISTPWPCFMLAAKASVITEKLGGIQAMLAALHEAAQLFHAEEMTMPKLVAERYKLDVRDAQAWFATVEICAERFISEAALQRVLTALKGTGSLPVEAVIKPHDLIDTRLAELRRDIKSVKLYRQSELLTALHKHLAAAGLASGPAAYTDFLPFDQHHYHGTAAIEDVVRTAKIDDSSRVINIGSGLGGPARYLAGSVKCQVLAVELQDDLHLTARELTSRCNLNNRVMHLSGDFQTLALHLHPGAYDHVVSWLTVLHISDRVGLFKKAYALLRPGGVFFAADFFALKPLTTDEWKILHDEVSCQSLASSVEAYISELVEAGFKIRSATDVTEDWKQVTQQRVETWTTDKDKLVATLGEQTFSGLLTFYTSIRDLYAGGNLGGIQIYAEKPLGW